ncbi:hypothetical protein BJF83_14800 [Nocardiopsis sp. CNR-923]|uniref:hypothetical protein n=1 Tax=Nocardiopsis sp. CNR-923 TaxID=1904965 RepID=UPI00095CA530|nr:hypothetical protein [Nocardiopsis sp. CNR-923]OLT28645.1 hypothetical protein BJF83_14800 [Nocardiopsis sp. CNR-923]
MSHWRLNNPRASRAKSALARRVKHKPRHAFCAERAITALLGELASLTPRQLYWSGTSDLAVMSVQCDVNVWCRDGRFFWNDLFRGGQTVSHPASDPVGAAALLNPFARISEASYSQHRHALAGLTAA